MLIIAWKGAGEWGEGGGLSEEGRWDFFFLVINQAGVPWWPNGLSIQHCHCCDSDCCCGIGSVPGPGTSDAVGMAKKKKS